MATNLKEEKKKGWMEANVSKENSWAHKKHLSCKINFISRLTSWCSSTSRKTNSSWISGRWMTTPLSGSEKSAKKKNSVRQRSWISQERQRLAGRNAKLSKRNLERNWLTKKRNWENTAKELREGVKTKRKKAEEGRRTSANSWSKQNSWNLLRLKLTKSKLGKKNTSKMGPTAVGV